MTDVKHLYITAYKEYLQGKYTVHVLKDTYKPKSIKSYVTSPPEALSEARKIIMYEWYIDNGCFPIVSDLFDYVLLPETDIDLSGVSFNAMAYTVSPETERIIFPEKFVKKKKK